MYHNYVRNTKKVTFFLLLNHAEDNCSGYSCWKTNYSLLCWHSGVILDYLPEAGTHGNHGLPPLKKGQIEAKVFGEQGTIIVTGEPVQNASQRGAQTLGESLWKYNCFTFLNLICYTEFGTPRNSVH
jgi:hypothetical protein